MDPGSRRFMWDVMTQHLRGRAAILTTHAMDEADALCTRIGIMVKGRMEGLGTSQVRCRPERGPRWAARHRTNGAPRPPAPRATHRRRATNST